MQMMIFPKNYKIFKVLKNKIFEYYKNKIFEYYKNKNFEYYKINLICVNDVTLGFLGLRVPNSDSS